eukprot:GEMP01069093.1.p1 GENE.GEMP01069093.1~~GEMP01069093.1.p1  ORF type:complete len:130 (+),score=25.65 GEMP01069093.1:371-760(+)
MEYLLLHRGVDSSLPRLRLFAFGNTGLSQWTHAFLGLSFVASFLLGVCVVYCLQRRSRRRKEEEEKDFATKVDAMVTRAKARETLKAWGVHHRSFSPDTQSKLSPNTIGSPFHSPRYSPRASRAFTHNL